MFESLVSMISSGAAASHTHTTADDVHHNGSRCRVVRCAGRAVQLMVLLSCGRGRGENIK